MKMLKKKKMREMNRHALFVHSALPIDILNQHFFLHNSFKKKENKTKQKSGDNCVVCVVCCIPLCTFTAFILIHYQFIEHSLEKHNNNTDSEFRNVISR